MSIQQEQPLQSTVGIDAALADLIAGEAVWGQTPVAERRRLLERVHALVGEHAQAWVEAAREVKQLPADTPLVGEEWLSGPYGTLQALAVLIESLRAIENGGSPVDGYELSDGPGGRVVVHGLPHNAYEKLLLHGFSAEVWMPPGVDAATVRAKAGLAELDPQTTGGVGVVLGAGNITSIPPLDVLYELYAENRVVALKLNPITDAMLPVFEKIFAPLTELGVVRILTGGAEVGAYLVQHAGVKHVHMTGSAATHDAIVWGRGDEAARRKAENRPQLEKEITSELGGVSPIIVIPGSWSKADLRFQAEHVATQRLHNGGYNCIAGQVLVVSSDWAQKDAFLAEVRTALSKAPARVAYYPGSDHRVADALAAYPDNCERLGPDLGRVLITGEADAEYLKNTEFFAPVLGVVELPGTGLEYFQTAVMAANDDFVGTLGVNVIVHPSTRRKMGDAFETTLAGLRYGCIAVNAWTGFGFLAAIASWGAFPGHTIDDVQSGIGVVHNALLLDGPERSVVRGPFRPAPRALLAGEFAMSPKPPWFVTARTAAVTARRLTAWAAAPGWRKVPGIVLSAMRG
jgi:aldehyde dehydrogenase (NAD(P)+)